MAARKRDAGRPFSRDAAVAKLIASDVAMKVTTDAVQVLGGYGYTRDYPAERYMRGGQGDPDLRGHQPDSAAGHQPPAAEVTSDWGFEGAEREWGNEAGERDVVLVTGGASGLGAATVRSVVAQGSVGTHR